ncbi:glycosyltransferase [Mesobacillus subterraneus]|uniref:glycosyltransferase n=1 Tax=Mesobacillus subterraneus TaxID=285983 RepID=UPI00203A6B2B|nr:glycosyltransferase [Mesobacillus subterraneus]MCM3665230.1 glycosyltransferase [Mesobacillus subterraneus]MCM3684243.1 glycosyltransferase [Mesobacillus subterraneus]
MKKKVLIASFDLAIGGVERSLIGLLNSIDYQQYDVDLMLFKHEGEFFSLLPEGPNLLPENPAYSTFRKSISQIIRDGRYPIAVSRLLAKYIGGIKGKLMKAEEPGYLIIQYGWELSRPFLPEITKEYDLAIGFLWPHHFIGEKVKAKRKVGWVHTDYSNILVDKKTESKMWENLDQIVAVSEECSNTFIRLFPHFKEKTLVIENILSQDFVRKQAEIQSAQEIKKERGKTILVSVGRLSHAKGFDKAIRACRQLVDKGYDIAWYVVGYGPLESELLKLISELELDNHFFLLGKKMNPYPYIKACDIYVQPSRYEGKAVTIREAQILGKPVVITNFPTAKSQVKDGLDGLITPMGVEGIVEGLQKLLDNPSLRDELIKNTNSMDYGNENEVEKIYSLINV